MARLRRALVALGLLVIPALLVLAGHVLAERPGAPVLPVADLVVAPAATTATAPPAAVRTAVGPTTAAPIGPDYRVDAPRGSGVQVTRVPAPREDGLEPQD